MEQSDPVGCKASLAQIVDFLQRIKLKHCAMWAIVRQGEKECRSDGKGALNQLQSAHAGSLILQANFSERTGGCHYPRISKWPRIKLGKGSKVDPCGNLEVSVGSRDGNIQSIVKSQLKSWSENKLLSRDKEWTGQVWPLITISRQFGSLGAAAGRAVADNIGFSFWDHELVEAIAKETGAGETLLDSLDEHARNRVEEFVAGLLMGKNATEEAFVHQVAKTVRTIYKHGRAVIVGRGGQFILFEEQALRVRVVADLETRIRNYAERNDLSHKDAEKVVKKTDVERAKFIEQQYHRDVSNAANYDIVLNAGSLSLDQLSEMIISAYKTKFSIDQRTIESHLKYAAKAS
jgi:cytidylate kinase